MIYGLSFNQSSKHGLGGDKFMFNRLALKKFIDESGLKQKAIAEKSGISESKLSLILTGKRGCDVDEYARICKAIGVPLTKFVKPHSLNDGRKGE